MLPKIETIDKNGRALKGSEPIKDLGVEPKMARNTPRRRFLECYSEIQRSVPAEELGWSSAAG